MENVLNTVKTKVKTTKILAIVGIVLIILGLFFNIGKLQPKVKDKDKFKSSFSSYYTLSDDQAKEAIKSIEKKDWEATAMKYWGGYVMLILGVAGACLVFIDFVETKLPEETRAKIKFWDKLKNPKLIAVVAAVILVLLVATWKTPINKYYSDEEKTDIKDISKEFDEMSEMGVKMKYSVETGFVFILLGSVALAAYPFVYKPEVVEATPVVENKEENA